MTPNEAIESAAAFLYEATGGLLDEVTFASVVDDMARALLLASATT